MLKSSRSTSRRGILAVIALSATTVSAHAAFLSAIPDPMASAGSAYTMDLQAAGHASVALPGLGVSATDFVISNFILNNSASHDTAAGYNWVYSADFQAFDGATPVTGILTSTDFTVQVDGQHFPVGPVTGMYVETLISASFTDGSVTWFLDPSFAAPTGTVNIQPASTGFGFDISPPSLVLNTQYIPSPGASAISIATLTDVNGNNGNSVPEPATLALLAMGLIGWLGARYRGQTISTAVV